MAGCHILSAQEFSYNGAIVVSSGFKYHRYLHLKVTLVLFVIKQKPALPDIEKTCLL